MFRYLISIGMILMSACSYASCLTDTELSALNQDESKYLVKKIPPYFKHQLEAGSISVSMKMVDKEACTVSLNLTLPKSDIAEANMILDAQPAKKIMLSAQGQSLPNAMENNAIFTVDTSKLKVTEADVLQTSPLGKLRGSVELMYALLTQERAKVDLNTTNNVPWPDNYKQGFINTCTEKNNQTMCACMAAEYASKITANQMVYIDYVRANPYALATGVNQAFEALTEKVTLACKS